MPFVWSIGTIIGPAIGGTFAEPAENFPDSFSSTGLFAKFPYLLPNLICAALMMISISLGYFFLEETHPLLRSAETAVPVPIAQRESETQALIVETADERSVVDVSVSTESYGTFDHVNVHVQSVEEDRDSVDIDLFTEKPISKDTLNHSIWTYKIVMLLLALGIFSYHSMCFDHLLPIFLQDSADDEPGSVNYFLPPGLGMSTFQVGTILSVSGLSALFIQAVVFPTLAYYMPTMRLLLLVTLLHPLTYLPMPFLAVLPANLVSTGIYAALTFRNFTSIIAYPLLLILLKQACPSPTVLGRINGLAASVGAAARMIAPPLAGYLYGWGATIGFTGLAWCGTAFVAVIGVGQIFLVKREKSSAATISCEVMAGQEIVVDYTGTDVPKGNSIHVSVVNVEGGDEAV